MSNARVPAAYRAAYCWMYIRYRLCIYLVQLLAHALDLILNVVFPLLFKPAHFFYLKLRLNYVLHTELFV